MKGFSNAAVTVALLAIYGTDAVATPAKLAKKDVDTRFPYTGPAVPVGDWVDQTVNGNGKGFPRLVEPPAVKPASKKPTNNINVVHISYLPTGINIHYQTPFGLTDKPTVRWSQYWWDLYETAYGSTKTYDRTPPCSEISAITQCSQYFHDVQITNLRPGTTYYYKIEASNGTTASGVLSFKTAKAAGDKSPLEVAVINDMGYTNAHGTHKYLLQAVENGVSFAWHGGDISYADDWYSGILPCESDWPVCYNGTSTELPGGYPIPDEYKTPLPAGEVPNQGGPQGGDMSVLYESNWDLWQNWMNSIWMKVPYMVLPGNHEAACAEFDGGNNVLTAYLNEDKANSSAPKSDLTYYSCPPSQRNFTAFQNRFTMHGEDSGGVSNFWYSFEQNQVHFVSIDTETDFPYSPEWPFVRDVKGADTLPTEAQTYSTDSGPFGYITNRNWTSNTAYEQYNWLKEDLESIDRTKINWVVVMGHRPMWSSQVSSYQSNIRNAFQDLMIDNGVDIYLAGHIHYYERMWPLSRTGQNVSGAIIDSNTYRADTGSSMIHLINGAAGNIESHSTVSKQLNITAYLDQEHYGFSKLKFLSATEATYQFIHGDDGSVGDQLKIIKKTDTTKGHGGYGWSGWW